MASLNYIGKETVSADGVVTAQSVSEILDSGVGRSYVAGRISSLAEPYATKAYVDAADAQFAQPSYFEERDKFNIPRSDRGAPGGVASLNSSGKVPESQMPRLGAGLVRGPYRFSSTYGGSAGTTPVRIATISLGLTGWNFTPLVFVTAAITALSSARATIEVRIGSTGVSSYSSQQLVAAGSTGPASGTLSVSAVPAGSAGPFAPNYDAQFTVWLYSESATQVTASTSAIFSSGIYIMRVD